MAGFLVENVAPVRAEPLVECPPPDGGAGLRHLLRHGGGRAHVQEFVALWPLVLAVALARMGAIYGSARTGGAGSRRAEPVVSAVRLDRAGVPGGGGTGPGDDRGGPASAGRSGHADADVGIIAFNESVGPVLFRRGLDRAGEIVVSVKG